MDRSQLGAQLLGLQEDDKPQKKKWYSEQQWNVTYYSYYAILSTVLRYNFASLMYHFMLLSSAPPRLLLHHPDSFSYWMLCRLHVSSTSCPVKSINCVSRCPVFLLQQHQLFKETHNIIQTHSGWICRARGKSDVCFHRLWLSVTKLLLVETQQQRKSPINSCLIVPDWTTLPPLLWCGSGSSWLVPFTLRNLTLTHLVVLMSDDTHNCVFPNGRRTEQHHSGNWSTDRRTLLLLLFLCILDFL